MRFNTPRVHFSRVSGNKKTGPIPTTVTEASTCPKTCSFRGSGCYAEHGPLAMHWRQVSAGNRGGTWQQLLGHIKDLPRHQLWRMNVAGDLPTTPAGNVSWAHLEALTQANKGRRGFTYTHHPPTPMTRRALRHANRGGFTVNLSAETLRQADQYAAYGLPVVVALPKGADKPVTTPAGRLVTVCPTTTGNTDCLNCGICYQADRKAIVGFPAHGTRANEVQRIFFAGTPANNQRAAEAA